jgi:hypothetical protein
MYTAVYYSAEHVDSILWPLGSINTINEDWRRCGGVRLIIEALVRFDRNREVLVRVDLVHRMAIRPVENEEVAVLIALRCR